MKPADVLVWITGVGLLPSSACGFASFGARYLGWPEWFVLVVLILVALVFSGIGYSLTTRYFEQAERDREPWRFMSRVLSLSVLMFAGLAGGFVMAEGHHETIRTLFGVIFGGSVYLVLSSVWFGFPDRHERGSRVLSEHEAHRKETELAEERREKNDPGLVLGKRVIPSWYASSHILFIGATRSGKTIQQRLLWQSILPRIHKGTDRRAVMFDAKRDLFPILAGMNLECDIITLNAFDVRGHAWWCSRDVYTEAHAKTYAELMVPFNPKLTQQHWDETLRGIIEQIIKIYIKNGVDWTFRDVVYPIDAGREVLEHVLSQSERGRVLLKRTFEANAEHGGNVDATLSAKARDFSIIAALWHQAEKEGKRIAFADWIREPTILLLGQYHQLEPAMRTLNQMLFKFLSMIILDQPNSRTREVWVLFDELREAGRLDGFSKLMVEGGSKGARMQAGYQDDSGLKAVYDVLEAEELIGQFQTIIATRLASDRTADALERRFGKFERWERKKSYTRSGSGWSETVSDELSTRPAVHASELTRMPIPTPHYGLDAWHLTPIGLHFEHLPGDYIDGHLLAENEEPDQKGMPGFIERPAHHQELLPWTAEDYERLKLPPFVPKPAEPKKGGKPKPQREERWLELVPDLPDERQAAGGGAKKRRRG